MITTFKPGYVEDLRLIDSELDWLNLPGHLGVRIKIQKYPVGFYVYKMAGQKVLEIEKFIVRPDYRRLRHGTEMMEYLIENSFNVNWLRAIVREDIDVGVCRFLQVMKFKGRLVGENYHFERRIA